MTESTIYLDYAASTPVAQGVLDEMLPYFTLEYGNPSNTLNSQSSGLSQVIELSQERIKGLLFANNYEVVFTSGATESANTCMKSLWALRSEGKNHIITCSTEHKAVLSVCEYLRDEKGAELTVLPVDRTGNISVKALENAITDKTCFVAIMAVNNETGVVHPISQIADVCNKKNVPYVCDATQGIGKIPIDLESISIDYLFGSGHKFYAPKGVGFLLLKKETPLHSLVHGGSQQNNHRAGTLNVPGIVAMGSAAKLMTDFGKKEYDRMKLLREHFEKVLINTGKVKVIGGEAFRSPFISNLYFTSNSISDLVSRIGNKILFSAGSACNADSPKGSDVLLAMSYTDEEASHCLRFSFGLNTTQEELDEALRTICSLL